MVISHLHSVGTWVDLKNILPRVLELLGCKIDELQVVATDCLEYEHLHTKLRDRVVATTKNPEQGPLEGLPFIRSTRRQGMGREKGYGLVLMEQQKSKIRYVLYSAPGQYNDAHYMFVANHNLWRYQRQAKAFAKLACRDRKPPILAPGILEDVVRNTIGFLQQAREIERYGVRIKRGLILDGSPGNGKTMLCRYIQKLCIDYNLKWGVVTSADMDRAYQDQQLEHLFRRYTVTFFDDIDISYLNRKSGNGKMACSILAAMDGIDNDSHLVRIFTTNEGIQDLDEAFTRPGRIDRTITLQKPTADLRRKLIEEVWPKVIQENIDVDRLVEQSEDLSFAELEAIRGFLVTNFILCNQKWDLQLALQQYADRKADGIKPVGFGLGSGLSYYNTPRTPEESEDDEL